MCEMGTEDFSTKLENQSDCGGIRKMNEKRQ